MNSEDQIAKPEIELEDLDIDSTESVDDFIRELEAKERDLHITADVSIEIEEPDFDPDSVPAFVAEEVTASTENKVGEKPQESHLGMKRRIHELEREIEKLHLRIAELKTERSEIQASNDRRLKDFQNFKYRVDRERRSSFIEQLANLATQMLPVLDNLDRALDAVEKSSGTRSPEFQQFYEGIVLVNQQVNEVLAEMGVTPILTVGETFDPVFHEAVAIVESDELPHNTISEEMLRGFRIGNRVIRHSMVKVATSPQAVTENAPVAEVTPAEERVESDVDLLAEFDDFEFPDDDVPASRDASPHEAE